MIEARELTKRYGDHDAVDHANFSVARGRVVGFLGLNGAGKTTTMRMVSCFMPPTSGTLSVAGHDTVRDSERVRRLIGYLPERVPLYDDMRVVEYLRYRARLKGVRGKGLRPALDRVLDRCGLRQRERSIIGTLSKGYRQRVGIADALVHDPDLLILDEPTSGLDPDQRIEVRALVRELGRERTVLLSTHILPEAEAVCDDVIVIHRGMIRAAETLATLRDRGAPRHRVRHTGAPLEIGSPVPLRTRTSEGETVVEYAEAGPAEELVLKAVQAGRTVRELVRLERSLEEVFIDLTTGREIGS